MKKITIIGNGGAGKSTLSLALGKELRLPVFHLDQVIWKPKWVAISENDFDRRHKEILDQPEWIIEGMGYDSTIEDRFISSDMIIYIDFPIAIHLYWAIKRSIKSIVVKPNGWQPGCQTVSKLPYILRIIWNVHKKTSPKILKLLEAARNNRKIVHIKSPTQLNAFYKTFHA